MPRKRKPKPNPSFHFNFRVVINHDEQSAQIHLVQYRGKRIIDFDPEPYTPIGSDWKMGKFLHHLSWMNKTSPANAIKELKRELANMRLAFKSPPLDLKKLLDIIETRRSELMDRNISVLSATEADMEAIRTKYPLPF